jgi:hypothetical protein
MCRRLLLLNAYLFDSLTVSYVPLLDIGNKEEVDSGEADCTDSCDVHDGDIDHENKAPLLSEAVWSGEDDGKAEDDGNDQGGALSLQLSCLVDVVVDAFSTGSDDVVFGGGRCDLVHGEDINHREIAPAIAEAWG